ncbi:Cytochrome P450 4V2 [Folsomia candida]|uniref:Cytochrome P450 4V2 n=1 Tax=Folsomia candida TaxID=158441 RepID=A0A226CXB3_FOLCA|nr:Cytochrome P450 4V2 [Folsomia candida]
MALPYFCWHLGDLMPRGFETTASPMNFTLFLLAENEECQRKVHEELDSVLKTDGDITFADLAELKYLEMCIKESLRIFPPGSLIIRHSVEDIPLDNGQIIPKGFEMVFIIREINRDPQYFPNPDEFDPNRFLPDTCVNRHPYAYIPFSAGPRNCIGMKYAMIQMKTCLAHILSKFHVSTTQKRKDLKIVYSILLETIPHIEEIFHKYLLLCEDVLQLYGLHIRRLTGLNSAKSSLKLCTVNTLFLFPPPIASSSSCLKFPIPTAYVLIPRAMAAFAAAIVTRFRTYCKNSPDN